MQRAIVSEHLRRRIARGDRVLDAGCGPGLFARELLDLGAAVTCFDISPVQLEACRTRAPGCEAYELGSITDLGRFADGAFDATLALGGALSYCFDRVGQGVAELVRVTRPGGRIGVSVMNLHGAIHHLLDAVLATPLEANRAIFATGDLPRGFGGGGHECHMFRRAELEALLAGAGVVDVELSANGWLVGAGAPELEPDVEQLLLEAELEASVESPAAGTHIIAWGRRAGRPCRPPGRAPR